MGAGVGPAAAAPWVPFALAAAVPAAAAAAAAAVSAAAPLASIPAIVPATVVVAVPLLGVGVPKVPVVPGVAPTDVVLLVARPAVAPCSLPAAGCILIPAGGGGGVIQPVTLPARAVVSHTGR